MIVSGLKAVVRKPNVNNKGKIRRISTFVYVHTGQIHCSGKEHSANNS
jgi:hypothetical protein